ncbi:MAG TPA: site-specific integrase [Blastocatellia bacterium]|nr:site-specific integrase [Blastocatellia bacterium]
MRQRSGYVFYDKERGHHVARITWTDSLGKRRYRKQKVATKTEGRQLLKKWGALLEQIGGDRMVDAAKLTFRKLADIYAERKLIPPVIRGTERVAGLRSYKVQRGYLKALLESFGARKIAGITHSDLEAYREARLQTKTYRGTDRSMANVHRELALLRAILNFAKRQGWLSRTPFEMGESVIRVANETQRDRILTRQEEERLLAVCTGKRSHLCAIVIGLVDTALRKGELLALEWRDVDLGSGLIHVRGETTKTLKERKVGITVRLKAELERLALLKAAPTDRVFPSGDFQKSFMTARQKAGIENLHAHDLRHTAITRWIQSGMPVAEVMRLSGHRTLNVAFRYINADDNTARRAAEAMDGFHAQFSEHKVSGFIN